MIIEKVEEKKNGFFGGVTRADGMRTFEEVSVREVVKSASDFLHKVHKHEIQKQFELNQQQEPKNIFGTGAGSKDVKILEAFNEAYIKFFFCRDGGEENNSGVSDVGGSARDRRYWVGRRPIPPVTEDEVDGALAQLTEEEIESLNAEFYAQQTSKCKTARKKKMICFAAKSKESLVKDRVLSHKKKGEKSPVMDFMKSDGKRVCFGNNVVEVTYQGNSWEYVGGDADEFWPNSGCSGNAVEETGFSIMNLGNITNNTSSSASSSTYSSSSSSLLNANDSLEKSRVSFIRDRVRTMLLANYVSKDIEREFFNFMPVFLAEWESERNEALKKSLKEHAELLKEAVRVSSTVKMLKNKAMGEYVKDFCYKQAWQRDETVSNCQRCQRAFVYGVSHHHCRRCGFIFCNACSSYSGMLLTANNEVRTESMWLRICHECYEICCEYQRTASKESSLPKRAYERDRLAPGDPPVLLLPGFTHPDGTLEDNLPPFYVVLPEERYSLQGVAISGLFNSLKFLPYSVIEGVQSAISSVSGIATQRVCGLITAAGGGVKEKIKF